jgi:hypothetical protein
MGERKKDMGHALMKKAVPSGEQICLKNNNHYNRKVTSNLFFWQDMVRKG